MKRIWMAGLVVLIAAGSGCDAIRYPSEGSVFRAAVEAAQTAPGFPAGAELGRQRDSMLYIAKNLAAVEIPIEYTNAEGQRVRDTVVVWMKRINRRWELDRAEMKPAYDRVSAGGES